MSKTTTITRDNFSECLWRNNPVFVMLLGMCPVLAVTNSDCCRCRSWALPDSEDNDMRQYLVAMIGVPLLLLWLGVQGLGRRSARAHPERGPYREEDGDENRGCHGGRCQQRPQHDQP